MPPGYKGFYYHFLDMTTGRRAWHSELSTVDSGFLLAGALTAAAYFDGDDDEEHQIRTVADELYRRADWRWAQNGGATLTHGYKPRARLPQLPMARLRRGAAAVRAGARLAHLSAARRELRAWLSTYAWKSIYGYEFVYAGPLFIHQLSHIWIDFRGIQDAYMRERGLDYFENSRRATYVQREYAIRNPREFAFYGKDCWGLTASDGPGPADRASRTASSAASSTTWRAAPRRARRWHDRALGSGGLAAVRAGDRHAGDPLLR